MPLPAKSAELSTFIYFSFVTLTTTGYGDIVPVNPLARSAANFEALTGQLFTATLLARLVTLHFLPANRAAPRSDK
ncbi:MAG: potassium channel family protein [Vulcanimicrobiaceae bacterium]